MSTEPTPVPTHNPVMVQEVLKYLNPKPNGIYLDGTIGLGGHSDQIYSQLNPKGSVIGLDRDSQALAIAEEKFQSKPSISLFQTSYDEFPTILNQLGISQIDGLLLDLGLSSLQLDSQKRGFAFRSNGILDMRFDEKSDTTAMDVIQQSTTDELANIIFKFGEERYSRKIARNIKKAKPMKSVNDIKEAIRISTPPAHRNKTLARVFQALRIVVNQELDRLKNFLEIFVDYLSNNGRIVIISYHSLEDRLVKHSFRELKQAGQLTLLTKKPVIPSPEEIETNSRSAAAKLRAAERL